MARLRLVSSNATFVALPVGRPAKYRDMVAKFPQVGTNTNMGVLQMQSAMQDVIQWSKSKRPATIQESILALAKGYQAALGGLVDLDRQCNVTINRDAGALKSMSPVVER